MIHSTSQVTRPSGISSTMAARHSHSRHPVAKRGFVVFLAP